MTERKHTFMGLFGKSKNVEPPSIDAFGAVSDEYQDDVEVDRYLKALEELRIHQPDAYECILEYWRKKLQQSRRVVLFNAAHGRDFIANVAIAQQAKSRTFEEIVDDMEQTTEKTRRPEREQLPEEVPAAVLAGS